MLRIEQRYSGTAPHHATLSLRIDQRIKSRLKVVLDDGRDAGLFLPRGQVLRGGDLLQSTDGLVIRIEAAIETVSTAHCADGLALAKACYHLGNRHVPLQIADTWVRYQHDHVLDAMVRGLGLTVAVEQAPFEPEAGAYSSTSHTPDHNHSHSDHQGHSYDPGHRDDHKHTHAHDFDHKHSHGQGQQHSHDDHSDDATIPKLKSRLPRSAS
jgi:urease accessory protein